ncbi:hypothetical protein LOD99_12121 [Oopsacas minuta]|uniref:Uncharacterized protein n=1 Tax=Oopsacas minuta TaxID=111878 RepID=A0AAV7JHL7_9METZ|nr:hypothetical protein LOD99_12121 [Oopsacas minuta]
MIILRLRLNFSVVDTETYLDIDGQTKIRSIKATLKEGAIPKYLPGCLDRLNDQTIKYPRLDRDKKERDSQIQAIKQSVDVFEEEQKHHCLYFRCYKH